MKKIWFISLLAFLSYGVIAQTYSYQINNNKNEFLASFIFWSGSQLYNRLAPFDISNEINGLESQGIWGFDQSAIHQDSETANKVSDYLVYGSMATPMIFSLVASGKNNRSLDLIGMGLQGAFMQSGLNKLVKTFASRPRPFVYSRNMEELINSNNNRTYTESFFSGHTSASAYFTFYTAKVFSDIYPDSKWKPAVWGLAAAIPAMTGYMRYKAGKHFPSDVICGYLVGASFGYLIPELYKNPNLTIGGNSNGLSIALNF